MAAPPWVEEEVLDLAGTGSELSRICVYKAASLIDPTLSLLRDAPTQLFEFGSGYGEGILALDMFAKRFISKPKVVGSEIITARAACARTLTSMCKTLKKIAGDGIAVLEDKPNTFDLVVANMFGHFNVEESFARKFLSVAGLAIKEGGVIAMSSDSFTMNTVTTIATQLYARDVLVIPNMSEMPRGLRSEPRLYIIRQPV